MEKTVYTGLFCYNPRVTNLFSGHGWKIDLESATLPDGRVAERARASFADTVHLIAFDQKEKLVILREYRPFYKAYIWMLPSGHVDKETDATVAAGRELREETGFRADDLSFLWKANNSEKFKNSHFFYLAKDLHPDPLPQDKDEMIEVHHLDPEDALQKILTSSVVHMASGFGLLRYMHENPSI